MGSRSQKHHARDGRPLAFPRRQPFRRSGALPLLSHGTTRAGVAGILKDRLLRPSSYIYVQTHEDALGMDMDAGAQDRVDQALAFGGQGDEDRCQLLQQSWYTAAVLHGGLDVTEVGVRTKPVRVGAVRSVGSTVMFFVTTRGTSRVVTVMPRLTLSVGDGPDGENQVAVGRVVQNRVVATDAGVGQDGHVHASVKHGAALDPGCGVRSAWSPERGEGSHEPLEDFWMVGDVGSKSDFAGLTGSGIARMWRLKVVPVSAW